MGEQLSSEAAAVEWQDLDFDRPVPVVRICRGGADWQPGPTKTGTHRSVPMSSALRAALAALPRTHTRLFPKDGERIWGPASTTKHLHRMCDRAGIPRVGWHALRHTFATRFVAHGGQLPVLQKLLGHTTLKMTMRYVHVDDESAAAVSSLLDRAHPMPDPVGTLMVANPPKPADGQCREAAP